MIRAVANKRLDLSDEEYKYYCGLKDAFGENYFRGLFESDNNGVLTAVAPPIDREIPLVILFFVLNVMMNQRVRVLDSKINGFVMLEEKIIEYENLEKIFKRLDTLEKEVKGLKKEG